ncbi:P-loop containing nucleoside triphosphate hydrolase protein [Dacryopinax primogenitus]|uniref:p-loop containing nucleoside triphosphate hydrolase protein n=1 Tax=Dacryopinax primogenitus (strain DJM 731) TaxID=1858805 RepID=M5G1E8_DACPD|nr:P-loop containing nucleoside triphosphate hydrolase protein [Dacryopinax primogenitus]EJT99651.1 P-loop containing nucleoside triphosphate hydrolase protein [Dacryopinax primogenitus]
MHLLLHAAGIPESTSETVTGKRKIPHVSRVIGVSSAKGGVGKSTVAANLALTFQNALIGLLDLDIFGPSVPKLLGLEGAAKKLLPFRSQGIYATSMGFLVTPASTDESDVAIVWRGAMVQKAVQQLLFDVDWRAEEAKPLDLLVIDMPPGTGDVQLTLGELVSVDGAVIVTTPQQLSLADTRKGIAMFRKVHIPILGILLNYAYFTCPNCSDKHYLFGSSKGFYETAARLNVPVLGELPLASGLSESADAGRPVCGSDSNGQEDRTGGEQAVRRVMANAGAEIWERLSRPSP